MGGLPSTERALDRPARGARDARLDPTEHPHARDRDRRRGRRGGFRGSPTIRVDGVDLAARPPTTSLGLGLPHLPPSRRPHLARPRTPRSARRAAAGRRRRGDAMTLAIGDNAPEFDLPDTDGTTWSSPTARGRPWWCSPATTARTRWPGTTGSPTWRATTPTAACASSRSTPTTPSAIRATPTRRCIERVARRGLADALPVRRDAGRRPGLRREDHARRVRARRRAAACAIGARRLRLRGPEPNGPPGCAMRSTPCSAARSPHSRDRARRLLDQVEAVGGRWSGGSARGAVQATWPSTGSSGSPSAAQSCNPPAMLWAS